MTYLGLSFLAPAVGIFPYLLIAGWPQRLPGIGLWTLLIVGNVGVALMLVIMAYTVAFFGAFTPDRVVKRRFIRFLLRGPIQATVVVMIIVGASKAEGFLGIPSFRLILFGVVAAILLIQLAIELAKPVIDRLLYKRDREEIAWLQELSNRLLTTTDLHQFLENVLTAICDLLRTASAFVAIVSNGDAQMIVVSGQENEVAPPGETLGAIAEGTLPPHLEKHGIFFTWDGYWLLPLRSRVGDAVTGVLGVSARTAVPNLSEQEGEGLATLVAQIEAALEDLRIQQGLFATLKQIMPQIEDIQRRRSLLRYEGAAALQVLTNLVGDPDFPRWVRDALSHYWGGPKLTHSPLLNLQVVERASQEHGGTVNALRAVLQRAIERLRPEGARSMTAAEWLLYNILELKFIRGYKVRDVALRLAMSESDLYRKQRLAISEAARALAEMERQEQLKPAGSSEPVGTRVSDESFQAVGGEI
jgi:hypothetical protein